MFRIKFSKPNSVGSFNSESQELISCSQTSSYSNTEEPKEKREILKIKRKTKTSELDALRMFYDDHDLIFPPFLNSPLDPSECVDGLEQIETSLLDLFQQLIGFLMLDSDVSQQVERIAIKCCVIW